jgi:alkylation response protein AidB-like acyl-CoA dehydrogenase
MSPFPLTLGDFEFLLRHGLAARLGEAVPEQDVDVWLTLLVEFARFVEREISPIAAGGDEGCRFEGGRVRLPPGYRTAWNALREGGWLGISAPEAWGGAGLPQLVQTFADELLVAGDLAFAVEAGLSRCAIETLLAHGSEDQKARFLPGLVLGTTAATMCLTEPQAGSDIGLVATRARLSGEGAYRLDGTKIFITGGDHDLTADILHLVLARLPDAPAGTRGVSLFLASSRRADAGRNGVNCISIEKKMGLRAVPAAALVFEDAEAELIGKANGGLAAMFTMMNAERLFVGVQGHAVASTAHAIAASYAATRLQGRLATGEPASIEQHPDVARMLLMQRVIVEGSRALAARVAVELDVSQRNASDAVRRQAASAVALLTPVVKAAGTDLGLEATISAQQTLGGHGYIRDWRIEQLVRDVRVTSIYEGTNGIQALDLVTRKLRLENGGAARRHFAAIRRAAEQARVIGLAGLAEELGQALGALEAHTAAIVTAPPERAAAAATSYLQLFALTTHGLVWSDLAAAAVESRSPKGERKPALAIFFTDNLLPRWRAASRIIAAALARSASSGIAA